MQGEVRASLFGAIATIALTASTIGAGTASAAPGRHDEPAVSISQHTYLDNHK